MSNMFSRLYTYRERPSVSPLENFLTEATAEMFDRLPQDMKRSFVDMLLAPAARAALSDALPDIKRLAIRTQVSAETTSSSKRPDLVVHADGRDIIVIEAKVGAGLQKHAEAAEGGLDEDRIVRNQLETYARWIATGNDREDAWCGAVVFLTAYTDAPDDFVDGRPDGVFRSVRRWKDVGDWILDEVRIERPDVTHCAIASELHRFLKERNLMTKYMSGRDLAAAMLFAKSSTPLHATFHEVVKAVGKHAPKLKGGRQIDAGFWGEANIYWGWFNFAKSVKRKASKPYFAVGICFEIGETYAADAAKLPKHEPFFFLSCADDWRVEKPTTFLKAVPEGWIEIDDDWTITIARPVRDFSADPDVRVEELKAWASTEVDRLVDCIPGFDEAPVEAVAPEEETASVEAAH